MVKKKEVYAFCARNLFPILYCLSFYGTHILYVRAAKYGKS